MKSSKRSLSGHSPVPAKTGLNSTLLPPVAALGTTAIRYILGGLYHQHNQNTNLKLEAAINDKNVRADYLL